MSDSRIEFTQKLKELLLKPRPVKSEPLVVEHQRYSFSVSADLEKTIEEKLKESGKKLPTAFQNKKMDETRLPSEFDELNNDQGEVSFLTLEQICNKSASDPESTLYEYMHSDCKEEVIANAVGRHSQNGGKEEENMYDFCKHYLNTHKLEDLTQLDNIEAPSKLWDNTVAGNEQTFVTSPVKMVGLLRPSTILEETETMCNRESLSHTNSYETAADYTCSTQAKTEAYYSLSSEIVEKAELNVSLIEIDESVDKSNKSMSLLDASNAADEHFKEDDETFEINKNKVAEIEEDNFDSFYDDESLKHLSSELNITGLFPSESRNNSIKKQEINEISLNDSVVEIFSDEEDKENTQEELSLTNSLLNISAEEKMNVYNNKNSLQSPTHFNDTLEEVDYLMKKGMELRMAEEQQKKKENKLPNSNVLSTKQNNFLRILSPKCEKTQNKVTSAKKGLNSAVNIIKPPTKFEFKIPLGSANKKTGNLKLPTPKRFDHVVSPISMYVKHGTEAAFMMNELRSKSNERDFQKSSTMRNLKTQTTNSLKKEKEKKKLENSFVLPKEQYISAEMKHMVDKRTAIPSGGKKMQQYVETALFPTVLAHNGHVHLNSVQRQLFNKKSDESLADLSTQSCDLSLYTIKDAQKF